jgi:hypothetical protein
MMELALYLVVGLAIAFLMRLDNKGPTSLLKWALLTLTWPIAILVNLAVLVVVIFRLLSRKEI